SLIRRKRRLFIGKCADKDNKKLSDKYKAACRTVKIVVKQSVIDFGISKTRQINFDKLIFDESNSTISTKKK
ncbi:hypothetical protein BpHYR1_016642, partial [Brachionus plicatilis]